MVKCTQCRWYKFDQKESCGTCHHPLYEKLWKNKTFQVISDLNMHGETIRFELKGITVKGRLQSYESGEFRHPFHFNVKDLVECTGYDPIKEIK